MTNIQTITELPEYVAHLPEDKRMRFERVFRIDRSTGYCSVPETMRAWVTTRFGGLETVQHQHVIRVTNLVTFDGALYNPLRRRRSQSFHQSPPPSDDSFSQPLLYTAEDKFGRIYGSSCLTASNIAKWDGLCSILIFKDPDVLSFTQESIRDCLRTSLVWAERAHQYDPEARYFIWIWNSGAKAGASMAHAHAQMALTRGMHYAKVEWLRQAALRYSRQHGASFFDDLLAIHEDVGLAFQAGRLRGFFYLAAGRPKDTWIYGRAINDDLADAMYIALKGLVMGCGMQSFNVAILAPPLFPESNEEGWAEFPVIVRIGDRGAQNAVTSDIGALELYAQNVIPEDPFEVMAAWQHHRAETNYQAVLHSAIA